MHTIKQIIPANGWKAAFKDSDTGELITAPLICWALFEHEDDGGTFVDGISDDPFSTFEGVQKIDNFAGYVSPNADADAYTDAPASLSTTDATATD